MAGVKGIFQVFASCLRQGERRNPADYSGRRIRLPGKLRPGRKVHPAGKPPGQARRRKIPIGGLCPPFSLQQVSPPGPAPTRQKANAPPAGTPTEALRPGPGTRKADTALPPQRNMFRPALSTVCAAPHGKTPFSNVPPGGCGFSSLPARKRTKKPCRGAQGALKLQGFKRRKAPETGAFPKITLASAYFPT